MKAKKKSAGEGTVAEWAQISTNLRTTIRGLKETDFDLRGGSENLSIREYIHHLVEANLVASNMVIAALANNGGNFDWTWVNPDQAWMRRVGYNRADVAPAIEALSALCRHISELVTSQPGMLDRCVRLNDSPGAKRYEMTVEQILRQEREHANHHLTDIRLTRKVHLSK